MYIPTPVPQPPGPFSATPLPAPRMGQWIPQPLQAVQPSHELPSPGEGTSPCQAARPPRGLNCLPAAAGFGPRVPDSPPASLPQDRPQLPSRPVPEHKTDTATGKPLAPQSFRLNCLLNHIQNPADWARKEPRKADCQPRARRERNQITRVFCAPQAPLLPVCGGQDWRWRLFEESGVARQGRGRLQSAGYHLRQGKQKRRNPRYSRSGWSWAPAFNAPASRYLGRFAIRPLRQW